MKKYFFEKRILLILFSIFLLFSGCVQQISFEEGLKSTNNIWKKNYLFPLKKQWPHEIELKKLSQQEFNSLEEKLNAVEQEFNSFDQNLSGFAAGKELYALKSFISLNLDYVSYLKKEKEFLFIFNDSIVSLQESLQGFADANALFAECSSNSLQEATSLLQELSMKAELLNEELKLFNKAYGSTVKEDFSEEKAIAENKLFNLFILFSSLQNIFEKNCELQKNIFEWKEDYYELLQEEDLCKEIDKFEALTLKAKQFTKQQQSLIFEIEKLQSSSASNLQLQELSVLSTELTEAEIELERIFYSLKVSCGKA